MLNRFRQINLRIEDFLCTPEDDDTLRARRLATFWALVLSVLFPISWLFLYIQFELAGAIWFQFAVVVLGLLEFLFYLRVKNYTLSVHLAMLRLFAVLVGNHVFLGGFISSGMALSSLVIGPLIGSILLGRRAALGYAALYFGVITLAGFFEPVLAANAPEIPGNFKRTNLVMSLLANGVFIILINRYLVRQLEDARERADNLLLNILPAAIAARLKRERKTIARRYADAGILFADIVGFTPLASELAPEELVRLLNRIYSEFDSLATRLGVEKITTIGDSYMVASGIPVPEPDHLNRLAKMALAMQAMGSGLQEIHGHRLQMRIGMHCGPLVAGVIGQSKFQYDVWGDTVNTASRMESHGLPGQIHVSQSVYERLKGNYRFKPRGEVEIKGKGRMRTWFLEP